MVWRECLKCCHSQLIQLGGNGSSRKIRNFNGRDVPEISDAERQKALKLEAVVEIIKSLIYGGGSDNAGGGFSLDELEDSGYLDFRNVLKSMIQ